MPSSGGEPATASGTAATTANQEPEVITSTNTTMENIEIPGEKRLKTATEGPNTPKPSSVVSPAPAAPGTHVYAVIQTANPISALYEYCKKGM